MLTAEKRLPRPTHFVSGKYPRPPQAATRPNHRAEAAAAAKCLRNVLLMLSIPHILVVFATTHFRRALGRISRHSGRTPNFGAVVGDRSAPVWPPWRLRKVGRLLRPSCPFAPESSRASKPSNACCIFGIFTLFRAELTQIRRIRVLFS